MASTKLGEFKEDSNGTEREAITFNDIVRLRADSMPIKQPSSSHHPPKPRYNYNAAFSLSYLQSYAIPLPYELHHYKKVTCIKPL